MAVNLTNAPTVQDFTTLEAVKILLDVEPTDCTRDALIAQLISDVSARFVSFLGLHAVSAERTEVYELGQSKKILSLDAKPVDTAQAFTVKLGSAGTDFATAGEVSSSSYTVSAPGGWIRFRIDTPNDPNLVQVTYTGGLGSSTAEIMSNFPDLASACGLQVKYLLNRRDSLGGNVTVHGTAAGFGSGGTSYTGQYGLLKEVEQMLETHRRTAP